MNKISNPHRLKANVLNISHALALMCAAAPFVAQAQEAVDLKPVNITAKAPDTPAASVSAPSQGSLSARSAQSVVSNEFIRNYTAPIADYTQALAMTPGMFSYSPNGVGLGDAAQTIRGMSDAYAVLSFDGIPFNDTNGVSHHSWVFFPSQFLGGATVDRSPGSAATIGQANFVGSIDLKSRVLEPDARTSVTGSYGSWGTTLLNLEHETGQFGADGKSNLLFNVQEMKSDGYQTFNDQDRKALSAKFQTALGDHTVLTLFGDVLNLKNNTPSIKGLSRSNYNSGNYNYLLQNTDPSTGTTYAPYNFYNIDTNWFYAGIDSDLGNGWKLEDKAYRYQYHNPQFYDKSNPVSSSSAITKLNSYITMGNVLRLTKDSDFGTLRTGLWLDQAASFRYQIPSDPRTWAQQAAPLFNETYTTTTVQPYVEYEFKLSNALKITPGVKYASYAQDYTHLQDNGGAVGTLGGTYNKAAGTITGGAPSIANSVNYTDVLPSLDIHYQLQPNWSTYAQFSEGDEIPPTSIFDVKNAQVGTNPRPTKAKTVQIGTVWNSDRFTLAADMYHSTLDGAYVLDPASVASGNPSYFLGGTQISQGFEVEGNVALGSGFSLYANGTFGSLKDKATGQWIAGAPRDTETLGLNYQRAGWAGGLSANRVGTMYNDGTAATGGAVVHQAFTLDPVVVTNMFVNYTIKNPTSFAKQAKLQFGVNNLFDRHSIVAVAAPAAGSTSANPNSADALTILSGRSVSITATLDF